MRRSLVARVSVLALLALFAFDGGALAVSYDAPTSLTISRRPDGRVDPGTRVTIRGRGSRLAGRAPAQGDPADTDG